MNFIKKNIILFSVLLISLLISGAFIFLVIKQTNQMNAANVRVTDLKTKIHELNKQSPIPSQENSDRINADAEIIEAKTKNIQQIFCRPYKDAVEAFLKELGMTREEFFPIWRKTFEEEAQKGSPRGLIFNKFFAKFDKEKKINAIKAFGRIVEATSVEPLNPANIDGCLMEALGVPRKMEPIPCKKYMMDMQDNLISAMKTQRCKSCGELIPKEDFETEPPQCSKCKGDPGELDMFTFGEGNEGNVVEKLTFEAKFDGTSLPRPDEVSYIFKHLKLIEDLFGRIKKSGVKNLNSITKESLKGNTVGDYMVFTYDLKVIGSLNAVRFLMNDLRQAYRDNRIYKIRTVTMEASEDAKSIVSQSAESIPKPRRSSDEENENVEEEEAGITIIGNDDTVTAEIKFDYIIFIGDELTEND